jgi:hypothetical protein
MYIKPLPAIIGTADILVVSALRLAAVINGALTLCSVPKPPEMVAAPAKRD